MVCSNSSWLSADGALCYLEKIRSRAAHIFLERIGIVKPQDEFALVLVRQESVQDGRFQVTNVEVSRRLGG